MNETPIATLGGYPLLALETVGWRLTQGTTPYMRAFEMKLSDAKALLKDTENRVEVDLVIGPTTIQALSIINPAPAMHPDRLSVVVADCRYWWEYKIIERHFNVRRLSGERRLVDGENFEDRLKNNRIPPVSDLTFAKYSMNGKERWKAKDIVEDVLKELTGKYGYDMSKVDWSKMREVDGLVLRDDGQSALKRVMNFVPSLTGYINRAGKYVLTLTTGGEEIGQLAKSDYPFVGSNLPLKVDMSRVRPSEIHVYFQCEDELRFDYEENLQTTVTQDSPTFPPRKLLNIMPLPDRSLLYVSGPRSGERVTQGTMVPIDQDLLNAWNQDKDNPAAIKLPGTNLVRENLSFDLIWILWNSPGGYNYFYEGAGNSVWAMRWKAILAHYRQTFQVTREWRDVLLYLEPRRLAIQDEETATQAPASIYSDYSIIASAKRILASEDSEKAFRQHGTNNPVWSSFAPKQKIKDAIESINAHLSSGWPEDIMAFRIVYKNNWQGDDEAIIPSLIDSVDLPTVPPTCVLSGNYKRTTIPIQSPGVMLDACMANMAWLSSAHRTTLIVTGATAAPNKIGGLHKIVVTPDDAKSVLPTSVAANIGECRGPVMQLRVGSEIAKARFAWLDESGDNNSTDMAIFNGGRRLDNRLIDPLYLKDVANVFGAVTYGLMADRTEGAHITAMDPNHVPVGRIASVVHSLSQHGTLRTSQDMPPHVSTLDFLALLPESTRRRLFQKVQT